MNKTYYKKKRTVPTRVIIRACGALLTVGGLSIVLYIFLPLILWQITYAPIFAAQDVTSPIPRTKIVSASTVKSLITASINSLEGIDYTNAQNWFPGYSGTRNTIAKSYFLSIPKIHLGNVFVSGTDNDLSKHLVHFGDSALPGQKGTTIVFGHSTLPQLYNPTDYKTIFAHLHEIQVGDEIFASLDSVRYSYKIYNISIVDPDDTAVLTQNYDDSYITIITCTPPGTIWKRLVVQARLEKI